MIPRTHRRRHASTVLLLLSGSAPVLAVGGGELHTLTPTNGSPQARFGHACAVDGNLLVVGANLDDAAGQDAGAAYVFLADTGQELSVLQPNDPVDGKWFGYSVAISGQLAVVGAWGDAETGTQAGAAYVFDAATGQQLAKLLPNDPGHAKQLGVSVAISGSLVLAGAPGDQPFGVDSGSAYVFDATSGTQLAKLVPSDGSKSASFGYNVALDGSLAVIGAPFDDDAAPSAGSAYLFDVSTGQQLAKLLPSGVQQTAWFGLAVDVHGQRAVVGAPHMGSVGTSSGAAYLFDVVSGMELMRLVPDELTQFDQLGFSVGIGPSSILVGAWNDGQNGNSAGAAYLFDAATGLRIARLTPEDAAPVQQFGWSAALSGRLALVGAPGHDTNGFGSGAAYLFDASSGIAVPYCFGTDSSCPCANGGDFGNGCANSSFAGGARLGSSGSPRVSDDDFVLSVSGSRPGTTGLFFQGEQALAGGQGVPLGDGLRCAGGTTRRIEVSTADASGAVSSTVPIAATLGLMPGDVRRYQWWYRDPGSSPCGMQVNLSNGLRVTWAP